MVTLKGLTTFTSSFRRRRRRPLFIYLFYLFTSANKELNCTVREYYELYLKLLKLIKSVAKSATKNKTERYLQ